MTVIAWNDIKVGSTYQAYSRKSKRITARKVTSIRTLRGGRHVTMPESGWDSVMYDHPQFGPQHMRASAFADAVNNATRRESGVHQEREGGC